MKQSCQSTVYQDCVCVLMCQWTAQRGALIRKGFNGFQYMKLYSNAVTSVSEFDPLNLVFSALNRAIKNKDKPNE